jgi:Ring finger domain
MQLRTNTVSAPTQSPHKAESGGNGVNETEIIILCVIVACVWCVLMICAERWRNGTRSPEAHPDVSESAEKRVQREAQRKQIIEETLIVHEWSTDSESASDSVILHEVGPVARFGDDRSVACVMKSLRQISELHEEQFSSKRSFGEEEGCAICQAVFEETHRVCESNCSDCKHMFHESCMTDWLLKHRSCPICRVPYLLGKAKNDVTTP